MPDRRTFLSTTGLFLLGAGCSRRKVAPEDPLLVNDVHSQLNPTHVDQIVAPRSLEELQTAIQTAGTQQKAVCIAGGRHATGGQQFARSAVLVDTRTLTRVLKLVEEKGLVEVQAGIQWPQLVAHLIRMQEGRPRQWGIRQKQSGTDRLCLGGALSANAHGRGLRMKPIIFNLHTEHTPEGQQHSAAAFRRLIDMAIRRGGSYYLTYHRHATREQVEACYPQFGEFLRLKRQYDPEERFQSDWYRHYKELFA